MPIKKAVSKLGKKKPTPRMNARKTLPSQAPAIELAVEAALPLTPKPEFTSLHWIHGVEGLVLCYWGASFLFNYSAFIGLTAIGIGSLMAGIAFGRD